jgi:DNA-directed RNA polymerase subunit RPC12/RpoP
MPKVLCFDCGGNFEVDYDTAEPTKQCPKCKV